MSREYASKRMLDLCDQAIELSLEERDSFLARECEGDPRLRASVASVLIAIEQADDFLDVESEEAAADDLVDQKIDKYEILSTLGEGGMGTVYLAERREKDYKQQVAIKLVRGRFLSLDLIQRFQSERKILAALTHPYIAGLIDGGTTAKGNPYLVMERVNGLPLDQYCDKHRLDVRQRLELIQKVALAVQFAHQNLVVHCDLKPSNILVTDDGIPKLLDFGIAKLIEPEATKRVGHTFISGRQAMTPEYASPEQILDGKATTASDVYTLGVLSYEILTGRRPYHIETTSHRELLRFVEGLSVPRPSARLKTGDSVDVATEVATRRATTPGRLAKTLKGDLDNILLMALHRRPERRYPSVSQFSDDIKRYLDGMPVAAHADSLGYRTRTFVKRNWLAVALLSLIALSLLVGSGAFAWQARVASQQRDRARQEASTAEGAVEFLKTVLWSANPWDGSENEATVRDVLTYAETHLDELRSNDPDTEIYLRSSMSEIYVGRGDYEKAEAQSRAAIDLVEELGRREDPSTANAYRAHGFALVDLGENEAARDTLAHAVDLYTRQDARDWVGYSNTLNLMGAVQSALGDEAMAESYYRQAIRVHGESGVDDPPQLLSYYNNLSTALSNQGKTEEGEKALAQALRRAQSAGVSDPDVATVLANRAGMLTNLGRYDDAVKVYREAISLQSRSLGSDHPEAITTATSLGHLFEKMGDYQSAERTLNPVLTIARTTLPEGHFITAYVENILGLVLCNSGRPEEGMPLLTSALETRKAALPEGHWAIASTENAMGSCLTTSGHYPLAESYLLRTYDILTKARGEDHALTLRARKRLFTLYTTWGLPEKAKQYRATP